MAKVPGFYLIYLASSVSHTLHNIESLSLANIRETPSLNELKTCGVPLDIFLNLMFVEIENTHERHLYAGRSRRKNAGTDPMKLSQNQCYSTGSDKSVAGFKEVSFAANRNRTSWDNSDSH